ncbi:MAG: hypothetical protein ABIS86_01605 [Streptosporangiaceae bacterium]
MPAELIAFLSNICYYLAFAVWKVAVGRMDPLHGAHPLHAMGQGLRDSGWWVGLLLMVGGAGLQVTALTTLPLNVAAPIFAASLIPLLLLAVFYFQERLAPREWLCLGFVGVAFVLLALSVSDQPLTVTTGRTVPILLVAVLSLVIPGWLFTSGDYTQGGRHARPVSGVAYGIGVGIVYGTSELMIKSLSDLYRAGYGIADIAATPQPYILILTATTSYVMTGIALQRCRMAIVITVGTITSQVQLLLVGSVLYGEASPGTIGVALRIGALVIAGTAIFLFPRQEKRAYELSV